MDTAPTAPGYTLLGEPAGDGTYKLVTARTEEIDVARVLTVPTARLTGWLMERGCEFCAYQVKLGRRVRCEHPPLTLEDLSELGFAVDGL